MTKNCIPPILVIGMHRSGTTMIAKILSTLGVFMGHMMEENFEPTFFYERNERILKACNASWDNPSAIEVLLNHPQLREKVRENLCEDLDSLAFSSYLGPKRFLKYKVTHTIDFPWGWKDPRTTFLLPLWLDIFPNSKIIHIYRNAIDVAHSLSTRERQRIQLPFQKEAMVHKLVTKQIELLRDKKFSQYLRIKIRKLCVKIDPLQRYDSLGIQPIVELEHGYKLWCLYIQKALEYHETIADQIFSIKYEDFLVQPAYYLEKLQGFCNLRFDREKIKSISNDINPDRRFAFMKDKALYKYYLAIKDNQWMHKLGYNVINDN